MPHLHRETDGKLRPGHAKRQYPLSTRASYTLGSATPAPTRRPRTKVNTDIQSTAIVQFADRDPMQAWIFNSLLIANP
jgi:hypothetical protein